MALVNGGFLHCMDIKKFLKNLFSETADQTLKQFHRNQGLTSAAVRLPLSGCNCYRQAAFAIFEPARESKILGPFQSIRVFMADTSTFLSLRTDRQMDIKLFMEFL